MCFCGLVASCWVLLFLSQVFVMFWPVVFLLATFPRKTANQNLRVEKISRLLPSLIMFLIAQKGFKCQRLISIDTFDPQNPLIQAALFANEIARVSGTKQTKAKLIYDIFSFLNFYFMRDYEGMMAKKKTAYNLQIQYIITITYSHPYLSYTFAPGSYIWLR